MNALPLLLVMLVFVGLAFKLALMVILACSGVLLWTIRMMIVAKRSRDEGRRLLARDDQS